jgi:gliding motility-associated-like protein
LTGPSTGDLFEQYVSPLSRTELIVTIEDTTGCFASDTTLIIVSTEFPFFIPTAFAPESSNIENAIFRPFVTNKVRTINFVRIFNRWGDLVYERTNFPIGDNSVGWDGTLNGKLLNTGVFVFFLEVEFIDGSVEEYAGDVVLVR